MRAADLDALEQIAAGYPSRERFLTELTLDPPQASGDLAGPPHLDEDFLILSTVHSAKGQEWCSVYVLNVADGNFPSEFATGKPEMIEEERRLLYVAMTRANNARLPGGDELRVRTSDFRDLPEIKRGLVVCNPPYGKRLELESDPKVCYREIGSHLVRAYPGWRKAMLCPDPALAKATGLPFRQVTELDNGGLRVGLFVTNPER